jgi:hypothetical protein
MDIPFCYKVAHLNPMNLDKGDIWRGAVVTIQHGVLTVGLWLDNDQYDEAIKSLAAAGWHCSDKTVVKSNWRPTQDGLGWPLTLQKNVKYQ